MSGRGPSLPLARGRSVSTDRPALIMGILNATPDSFWEGSRARTVEEGLRRALALAADGADIIDVGGESTRPGSDYVSLADEMDRVIPLIEAIRRECRLPISVDTRKAAVMRAAIAAGADILNDVSALADDPEMAPLAAETGIPVVLMHKKGTPDTMQDAPEYADVVREVADWLAERAHFAERAGIAREKIIVDPGIGFGKRFEDNVALIAGVAQIRARGYPVLMGLSRKSCIGRMTGRDAGDRLAGTIAANLVAVQNWASIVRVHDVAEARDSLEVMRELSACGIR